MSATTPVAPQPHVHRHGRPPAGCCPESALYPLICPPLPWLAAPPSGGSAQMAAGCPLPLA
eukprot:8031245-Alexandrium_andersonii.AAC.1